MTSYKTKEISVILQEENECKNHSIDPINRGIENKYITCTTKYLIR